MTISRDKYTDNKLAEEFDLIILLNDNHKSSGLEKGTLGTLISAYSQSNRPLYAAFERDNRTVEEPVGLHEFRVLNVKHQDDLGLVTAYLKRLQREKTARA